MTQLPVEDGKILIIDDEIGNVRVLERLLKGGNFRNIESVTDSRKAVDTYVQFRPDVIILDLKMPHYDGFEVMDQLKATERGTYLPILVLTAQREHPTRLRALESGAKDFLTKPFEMMEALTRVRNMLEVRLLHNQVREHNKSLETKVQERTQELEETRMEIIHRLGRAAEYRDNNTGMHVIRMSHYCYHLAREAGMSEEESHLLLQASPMHDVGKIGVPDQILMKTGELTEEEWEIMKLHPIIGAEILSGSKSQLLQMAETICMTHQERWNGSGYPLGLEGEEIPLVGRIVALCDVFDALTTQRHYKAAFTPEEAMRMIEDAKGIDFDPELVEAFQRILPQILEIREEFADHDRTSTYRALRSAIP